MESLIAHEKWTLFLHILYFILVHENYAIFKSNFYSWKLKNVCTLNFYRLHKKSNAKTYFKLLLFIRALFAIYTNLLQNIMDWLSYRRCRNWRRWRLSWFPSCICKLNSSHQIDLYILAANVTLGCLRNVLERLSYFHSCHLLYLYQLLTKTICSLLV